MSNSNKDERRYFAEGMGVFDRKRCSLEFGQEVPLRVVSCVSDRTAKLVAAALNLYERNSGFRLKVNATANAPLKNKE